MGGQYDICFGQTAWRTCWALQYVVSWQKGIAREMPGDMMRFVSLHAQNESIGQLNA